MKTRKRQKRQGKEEKVKGKGKKVQGKREAVQGKGRVDARVAFRRRPRVPPPDSDVWPPEYRGERWKPAYAILFAGKCLLCQYSCRQPQSRRMRDRWLRQDTPLLCTNHPCSPGELIEVLGSDTCRNFRAKHWERPRAKPAKSLPRSTIETSDPAVRRLPVGSSLFATVDAADYEKLRKYKWHVIRRGNKIYASRHTGRRYVYLHREIMRPRQGYVVDHIDGNGLNNCRSNLRVCTHRQNQANRGPRGGSSRFVGVYRHGNKWAAGIKCHGEYFYLGLFEDEVDAAKARDRKAVELHGPYAYLNFPEDWTFNKNGVGHPMVGGTGIEGQ
jgi:hypothetical protein